ncbi:uncharacterized protein [Ciconia boyciana]|uniref:uncharacterized protein isoform X2 n=1 Tax=Ciconia boyciana TaxID=52775 RepID=UPI003BA3AEBE
MTGTTVWLRDPQVPSPRRRCHLPVSAALQASRETLLGAAKFLKRRQLRKLLETEQTWRVSECLLVEDSSGAEEYLQQSLPYLQSPQEPLREAAVRFTGLAGRQLRDGRQEKLRVIYEALRGKVNDSSLSVSSLALQTLMILDAAVKEPPSAFRLQALCYRLRKAWRRRTLAPGAGWLAVLLELRAELIPGALHTDTTRAAGPAPLPAARGPARHTTPCVVAPRRQLRCRAAKPRGKVKESFCLPCPLQGHPGLDRCPLSAALPFHGKGRLGHEA